MNEKIISELCLEYFVENPQMVERCAVGQGNYVYIIECAKAKYVIRCSAEGNAYDNTVYWLEKLSSIGIPVPKVIRKGKFKGYEYLMLSYLEGKDIGLVYPQLGTDDKKAIAKEIVQIQNRVAALELENMEEDWSWCKFINYMLDRAGKRIAANGFFDVEKAEHLRKEIGGLKEYFEAVKPVAYLDDISSKNLLVHNGRISGIIDIDWIGIGDKLTFAALTNMALLNLEYDTDYVKYILDEMQVSDVERKAFLFYTLMYCVDFMGERGMQFMDRTVEVNGQIVDRLNGIYDRLWEEWKIDMSQLSIERNSDNINT